VRIKVPMWKIHQLRRDIIRCTGIKLCKLVRMCIEIPTEGSAARHSAQCFTFLEAAHFFFSKTSFTLWAIDSDRHFSRYKSGTILKIVCKKREGCKIWIRLNRLYSDYATTVTNFRVALRRNFWMSRRIQNC
jgi:hypothetical protein